MSRYDIKVLAKRVGWRVASKILWWISESLRHDYKQYRDTSWENDMSAMSFSEWVGLNRLFSARYGRDGSQ